MRGERTLPARLGRRWPGPVSEMTGGGSRRPPPRRCRPRGAGAHTSAERNSGRAGGAGTAARRASESWRSNRGGRASRRAQPPPPPPPPSPTTAPRGRGQRSNHGRSAAVMRELSGWMRCFTRDLSEARGQQPLTPLVCPSLIVLEKDPRHRSERAHDTPPEAELPPLAGTCSHNPTNRYAH